MSFTLKSKDVGGVGTLREASTMCGGNNISPQLSWENAPKGTKSFVVTIHDKDVPVSGSFWHWVVFDIPSNVTELVTNAGDITKNLAPKGAIQSMNDFGERGYGGPCPPPGHGWHAYLVTVHALDIESQNLTHDALPPTVAWNVWLHTIEQASLIFYYRNI